jgi:hypothetical protein
VARQLRFEAEAERELDEAAQRYEEQRPALGKRFLHEVELTAERIRQFPGVGAPVKHVPADLGTRQARSKTFLIKSSTSVRPTRSGSSPSLTTGDGLGIGWIGEMVHPRGT